MITGKAFSTISYNTKDFLLSVLDDLLSKDQIEFYMFINHLPEEDEAKEHIHLYVKPTHRNFDTNQFRNRLIQFIKGEQLPRRCLPCESSKFQDWFLYSLHDSSYLASKGQRRLYHYNIGDICTSDRSYMSDQYHRIDWTKINPIGAIIEAAYSGITFSEFIQQNPLPILQVRSAEFIFHSIQSDGSLCRNNRSTHTPIDKPDLKPWNDGT